ncbi:putative secreted effector protein [Blumeria graminis f. sp. tritici 96224]|nr:putative secreted effector protein [Blumeria graminis f. sp. tritici 96224]
MRLTSIVTIIQSASVFVTILAVKTTWHIDEDAKAFDCNLDLLRVYGIQTIHPVSPWRQYFPGLYQVTDEKFDELLQKPNDKRIVMYSDNSSTNYRFQELNNISSRKHYCTFTSVN